MDRLRDAARDHPARTVFTFLSDGGEQEHRIDFGRLDAWARSLAVRLVEHGRTGDRVLLLFPPGLAYIASFLGCLYAGRVAVPAYPTRSRRTLPRLRSILDDAEPAVVMAPPSLFPVMHRLFAEHDGWQRARPLPVDDGPVTDGAERWRPDGIDADTLAFLQYTSGSTSEPKGVMLAHRHLMANEAMIQRAFGTDSSSVIVSWLPLYHDMGLIGGVLHPLYLGAHAVLLPAADFLRRPRRWLQTISTFRATVSGAPDFAYDLCVRQLVEEERAALDLSSWRVAFNGAEPVRADTLDRFADAFAVAGFDRRAFFPCYGLAEATLLVTGRKGPDAFVEPLTAVVAVDALEHTGRAVAVEDAAAGSDGSGRETIRRLVASGLPPEGVDVRVVDAESRRAREPGQVGEVWVASDAVAAGYWRRDAASEATFRARLADHPDAGPFLRTGDLGFVDAGGGLFVTGRLKDLIILRGRNLAPQDLERTVEASHPSLRPTCGAAFSVEAAGEERLVLVQELEYRRKPDSDEVLAAIRRAVGEAHEVQPDAVVVIRPSSIPKTTSGKIQRRACRERFLSGDLDEVFSWRGEAFAGGAPSLDFSAVSPET
ncbi:MAG: fatty acyl-AMP ligase, partial [Acidobacteriota bacterium]